MFGLHLVRAGEIERTWTGDLAEAMDDRLIADYMVHKRFSDDETRSEREAEMSEATIVLDMETRRWVMAKIVIHCG